MMRVRSKASRAHTGAKTAWLAATLVCSAACSSAPITEPDAAAAGSPAAGGSAAGGSSSGSGATASAGTSTTAPIDAGPSYEKIDYPAGPYGVGVHATLENFAFLGWHDPIA